jgi:hypothetical protein
VNVAISCVDIKPDWADSDGDDCNTYATDGVCDQFGGCCEKDGLTARINCCACGGGVQSGDSEVCEDIDPHWLDFEGDDCEDYALNQYCSSWGSFSSNNEITADENCCICGGGKREADS